MFFQITWARLPELSSPYTVLTIGDTKYISNDRFAIEKPIRHEVGHLGKNISWHQYWIWFVDHCTTANQVHYTKSFLRFYYSNNFFYHFQWTLLYIFWVQIILEGKMQWNRLNLLKMTTDAVSKNWQTQHNILD